MAEKIRRVVTATNEEGKSYILLDDETPHILEMTGIGVVASEIWVTDGCPADNTGVADAADRPIALEPPPGAAVFRIGEFPPDKDWRGKTDGAEGFRAFLAEGAHAGDPDDAMMHQTNTIDFVIVIKGELTAVMQEGERTLYPGDCFVQRGTMHSWHNRTDQPAIVAAVLISAAPL
jgi:mannose-6-phosphate isomerase-like protein (cupin superfamily)